MNKYKKIMRLVMEKEEGERRREVRRITETMCLSIDESPPMVALSDGAAIMAAMFDLCSIHNIDTASEFLEAKERMEYLFEIMLDEMRNRFPAQRRKKEKEVDDI